MVTVQPSIAQLSPGDLLPCWRIDQRCFEGSEAYDVETFRYLLDHPSMLGFKLVGVSGRMIGFVIGMIEPDTTGHVITLAIAPEFRRLGYGRCLMHHLEDAFRKNDVRFARLEVRVGNKAAELLYIGLDYTPVKRIDTYYSNGEAALMMTKDLLRAGEVRG